MLNWVWSNRSGQHGAPTASKLTGCRRVCFRLGDVAWRISTCFKIFELSKPTSITFLIPSPFGGLTSPCSAPQPRSSVAAWHGFHLDVSYHAWYYVLPCPLVSHNISSKRTILARRAREYGVARDIRKVYQKMLSLQRHSCKLHPRDVFYCRPCAHPLTPYTTTSVEAILLDTKAPRFKRRCCPSKVICHSSQ
jgi:hypothetical protein